LPDTSKPAGGLDLVCPICTVAVAAGVGLFRAWGIDDVITGLWIGALIVSSIMWFVNWLNKKNIHFLFRKILVIIVFYALFLVPLWKPMGMIGLAGNTLWGIDKIMLGVILGTIIFILAVLSDLYLKKINNNGAVFAFEKVIIPITFLAIASLAVHWIIKIITL